jgi:hypothetical protein
MKVRKHKGINQKTGKLNKGYRYSGKKLKSGLCQIIKSKVKKGGKVLGRGSFGCVIEPAIRCNSDSNIKNKVSKIGLNSQDNNQDEIDIGKNLKEIDPNNKFFIYVEEDCKIQKQDINSTDFEKCKFGDYDFYNNVIMEQGYFDLEKFNQNYELNDTSVASIILKLLKCMEILLQNKYTYYDLKMLNIVVKQKKKLLTSLSSYNNYEVYLIDFGSDFMPKTWGEYDEKITKHNTIYLWPQEVFLQMEKWQKFLNKNISMQKFFKESRKDNIFVFSNKIMVYMIGKMFNESKRLIQQLKKTKIFDIITKMTEQNPWERPNIDQARKLILEIYNDKWIFQAKLK